MKKPAEIFLKTQEIFEKCQEIFKKCQVILAKNTGDFWACKAKKSCLQMDEGSLFWKNQQLCPGLIKP
jgi:exopolysaccharide biosynthesis protein